MHFLANKYAQKGTFSSLVKTSLSEELGHSLGEKFSLSSFTSNQITHLNDNVLPFNSM